MSFVRSDKDVLNRQNNRSMPMLSEQERQKKDAFQQKENKKIGMYFGYREQRFANSNTQMNGMLQKGIKCADTKFAKKNSLGGIDSKHKCIQSNQVMTPNGGAAFSVGVAHKQPAVADPEEELEIDFGGQPKQSLKFNNFFDKIKQKQQQQKVSPISAAIKANIPQTASRSNTTMSGVSQMKQPEKKKATYQEYLQRQKEIMGGAGAKPISSTRATVPAPSGLPASTSPFKKQQVGELSTIVRDRLGIRKQLEK